MSVTVWFSLLRRFWREALIGALALSAIAAAKVATHYRDEAARSEAVCDSRIAKMEGNYAEASRDALAAAQAHYAAELARIREEADTAARRAEEAAAAARRNAQAWRSRYREALENSDCKAWAEGEIRCPVE